METQSGRIQPELIIHTNPSWELSGKMDGDVQGVRTALLAELESISPLAAITSKEILKQKLESTSSPLMGELFPWMIQEITNMDKETVSRIATGWLAIYTYTIFLDRHLDSKTSISPQEFLTGSILAKKGLLSLHSNVVGTKYEELFNRALNLSAIGQLQDAIETPSIKFDGNIEEIAIKKNSLLIACACALAAHNEDYSDAILDFTGSFLLTLQYLDDLGDWEEDLIEKHTTTLSANLPRQISNDLSIFDMDHDEVLEQLIRTGTLSRVAFRIQTLLDATVNKISPLGSSLQSSHSYRFINQLRNELGIFNDRLAMAESMISNIPLHERQLLIKETRRGIQIVAQSS